MLTYCYSLKDGTIYERQYPMGEAPGEILVKQKIATRDFQAEQVGRPSKTGWPIECYASGVNAAQAGDLRDEFKKHGISCEVTAGGDPIYTSHEHRKRVLKARGLHDRASFN